MSFVFVDPRSHLHLSDLFHVGTSVEARYIAIDLIALWTTNTNVSYSIDGISRGVVERRSTGQTEYLYDQVLFRLEGLTNVEHTLRVDIERSGVLLVRLLSNRIEGAKVVLLFSLIT